MVSVLEPGQFIETTKTPLPGRVLGRGTVALLILLRVYIAIAIPIVVYTFLHALAISQP
jgi:hypothetical protein